MKFSTATLLLCLNAFTIAAPPAAPESHALSLRDGAPSKEIVYSDLTKRRGGGGGKGGGSGGGGRSGGSSGGTRSGTPPAYGNRYYGGATVPYTAGGKTPRRGISPALYPVGAFAFFPVLFLFPVFAYPYGYGYHWNDNGRNRTSNVTCLCEQYSECGCDPDGDQTNLANQLTNGKTAGAPVNSSNVRTIDYANGTTMSYINATLANGTSQGDDSGSAAVSSYRQMFTYTGYWAMVGTVIAGVTLL